MKALSLRLQPMRSYYESGITHPYAFRISQLQILRTAVKRFEKDINDALYADLKKSREEVFATETGLILAEISLVIKSLRRWMKPMRTKTNLLNFPSSSKILSQPKGVVFIIGPWNYPVHLSLIPLVGAIAAGNCIVLKPSELAPASSAVITRLINETFSSDYIRSYEGDGQEIVPWLMRDFLFDHIFYTGSGSLGKIIYQLAAKDLIPVTLELGGKTLKLIRDGHCLVYDGIDRIQNNTVFFKNGKQGNFDAIVAAIGYHKGYEQDILQVDKSRFDDLNVRLDKQKYFGKDGLYFCGFYVSPTGQIREIGMDALKIAKSIAGLFSQ